MKRETIWTIVVISWLSAIFLLTCDARGENFLNVDVVKIYDGDTITVNIPELPAVFGYYIGIRVAGIDTPEIRGKCPKELHMAQIARLEVKRLIGHNNNKVDLLNCERGKYFRLVCEVHTTHNIAEDLLHKNLAYPYFGKTKENPWCK